MTAPILGVALAMEEERANGADIPDSAITGLKVGMMGPLAGVGDPVFWATMRPVFGALGAGFAFAGIIYSTLRSRPDFYASVQHSGAGVRPLLCLGYGSHDPHE